MPYLEKKALRKIILEKCKKVSICPHCKELNGVVKKAGLLKIIHEKFRGKKNTDPLVKQTIGKFFFIYIWYFVIKYELNLNYLLINIIYFLEAYDSIIENNKELESLIASGLIYNLNPLDVLCLFQKIPEYQIPFLLMNPEVAKPEDMILTRLPVPPLCIRPSVTCEMKAGTYV